MKKLAYTSFSLIFLSACGMIGSEEYESEFTMETFSLGNSLVYDMPILESDVLQPSLDNDSSGGAVTKKNNRYWLSEYHNFLAEVEVGYELYQFDSDVIPYYVYTDKEMTETRYGTPAEIATVEINGREWIHTEYEPMEFESSDELLQSITHVFAHRSSFELYTYTFTMRLSEEEQNDQEKIDNSYARMNEVLELADFTNEPALTVDETLDTLQGTWHAGSAGYIVIEQTDLKWYRDARMSEDNVLDIDITRIIPLKHPTENIEYALAVLDYDTETIDGETFESEMMMTVLVHFNDENEMTFVNYDTVESYLLMREE